MTKGVYRNVALVSSSFSLRLRAIYFRDTIVSLPRSGGESDDISLPRIPTTAPKQPFTSGHVANVACDSSHQLTIATMHAFHSLVPIIGTAGKPHIYLFFSFVVRNISSPNYNPGIHTPQHAPRNTRDRSITRSLQSRVLIFDQNPFLLISQLKCIFFIF